MLNHINFDELKHQANGRWYDILTRLGVNESFLTGKHTPCVVCGGKDRFRWDNRNGDGGFFCNQCTPQSGNGFNLVMKFLNISFPEALEKVQSIVGISKRIDIPVKLELSGIKSNLNKLWLSSDPLCSSDFVSLYLHKRGLVLTPLNVRYNKACYESDSKTKMPAMVARIQNNQGMPVGVHRVFIDNNIKAKIASPEQMMPATESLKGSAIRLFSSQNKLLRPDILGVAEGIETAIACTQLYSIATWACINAPLMHSWLPPASIKKVVVFADNDANYVGQEAAYRLGRILHSRRLIVQVIVPVDTGTDFNDILLNRKKK